MRETKLKPLLLPGLCAFVLTGCLDSDDSNGNDRNIGTFTQIGVENLSYETRSRSGTTDEEGRYSYLPGETISFSIGDLPIASNVPTAPFLTSMDFTEEQRQRLQEGDISEEGFHTHRIAEEELASSNRIAINTMRLIMALGEDLQTDPSKPIRITDRTIEQLNRYLAENEPDIDFSQPVLSFASPRTPKYDKKGNLEGGSVVNQMLDEICFEPEGDELCEPPPTRKEISETTDDGLRQDLEQKRQQILDARHTLSEISQNDVKNFLLSEAKDFRLDLEAPYFLDPDAVTLAPDETGIQEIRIRRIGSGGVQLQGIGALDASAQGDALNLHSVDWQSGVVEYSHHGDAGDSGTILVNFKIESPDFENYRWFRKTVKVCVTENSQCSQ
ncbi:hypothetical protein [Halospina denitrificans]|uniref:hypothetical protein n=1 Tax=Halospina denitrificans TaxID=332522 RepID=UPI00105C5FF8|nr:hypothetical protein [Halospina denitrificans]